MRKKIFIIHGKGVKNGLGAEGGGDLDTVGSNVFYNVWINNFIKEKENRDAVYGKDYEFEFVNYQAGISHLKIHKGSDVYLPDFPIDALSPRLKFQLVTDADEIKIKNTLSDIYDKLKINIYSLSDKIDTDIKDIFNSLINKIKNYFFERGKLELAALSYLLDIFNNILLIYNLNIKPFKSFFKGINFQLFKEDILSIINGKYFQDLKDKYNNAPEAIKNAFTELHKLLLSNLFKIKLSDNLIIAFIELLNVLIKLDEVITITEENIDKGDISTIKSIFNNTVKISSDTFERFAKSYNSIKDKNIKELTNRIYKDISNLTTILKKIRTIKTKNSENKIIVMLAEEESLSPVQNIDVTFKILRGKTSFIKSKNNEINIKTDKNGAANVDLKIPKDDKYYISITYDDLNYLIYTNIKNKDTLKDIEESDNVSTSDILNNEEESSIEKGSEPQRALKVALKLIAKDFEVLKKNDVRLIRIDDHHPWTKEILQLLLKFKEQGIIVEGVTMSGLERGIEQPKEEQKCGTDLIYESLVENKPYDNSGYKYLRYLAHVQDLHIKEDKMAILLSKLIGSGFSKIEMVQGLAETKSKKDLKKLIRKKGWEDIVDNYEKSLKEVLPRVEKNIIRVRLLKKPENNNYSSNLGKYSLLKPLSFFMKDNAAKKDFIKRLYAKNPENKVDIYMALSPFTDRKAGEAKINVASAINYLKDKYKMDYFFYCYGSMLMTTRRVNEKKSELNLSTLVAYVGTKADGGHAEAATGKPASNPDFPKKKFPRVNDYNFFEYAVYIGSKVADYAGMELYDVSEAKIRHYDRNTENVLPNFEEHLVKLNFTDSNNEKITFLTVKNVVAKTKYDPQLNFSAAVNYLLYRKKFIADYFVYFQGSNKVILRNLSDKKNRLNLNDFVKFFGDKNDSGYLKVGVAQPSANKNFPLNRLKFINTYNYMEYLYYFIEKISEFSKFQFINFDPLMPKNNSPEFKNKLMQIKNSIITYKFNFEKSNYSMLFAFSPKTDSFKSKDAFSYITTLAFLKSEVKPDLIFFTNGFLFSLQNLNNSLNIDLKLFAKNFTISNDFISKQYLTDKISSLLNDKNIFANKINEINFFTLADLIQNSMSSTYKFQPIEFKENYVITIPASNEIIIEKLFNTHKKRKLQINNEPIKSIVIIKIPYLEKNIRLTLNEIVTYFISRLKTFDYIFVIKDKNTLMIKNIDDENNSLDFDKLSKSFGSNKDIIGIKSAIFHPSLNKNFNKELFSNVTNENSLDFIEYLLKEAKGIELL